MKLDDIRAEIAYLGTLDNASGQIVTLRDSRPDTILFEFGCPACSEVARKVADEYGEALVTIVNAAPVLVERIERTEAGAAALRAALNEIDHTPVGACADDFGNIEPCEQCGDMRTIAANALSATDAGAAPLAELAALRFAVALAIAKIEQILAGYRDDQELKAALDTLRKARAGGSKV